MTNSKYHNDNVSKQYVDEFKTRGAKHIVTFFHKESGLFGVYPVTSYSFDFGSDGAPIMRLGMLTGRVIASDVAGFEISIRDL